MFLQPGAMTNAKVVACHLAFVAVVSLMLGAGEHCGSCPDLDNSDTVNVYDLLAIIDDWPCTGEPGACLGDVNCDGIVDVFDVLELLSHWGECPILCADDCADAAHATLSHGDSHVFTGNNECATPDDCPLTDATSVGGLGNAWISFTLTETSAVTLSYCGSEGEWAHIWLLLTLGCPCTDTGPLPPAGLPFCVNEMNFEVTWQIVEPGTYYYPILLDPSLGSVGDYTITVSADEAAPMCGGEDAGNCCIANSTLGCEDEECCFATCAQDPFCCDDSFSGLFHWDEICAEWAQDNCEVCAIECSEKDVPPNDNCEDADFVALGNGTLSHTFQGSAFCSSIECDLFDDGQGHVWIAFELPHASDVTLSYCGSVNDQGDPYGDAWLTLAPDCPCESFVTTTEFAFSCPDGNVETTWLNLPAGTYYYPVLWNTAQGASGEYNITVSIPDPDFSCAGNCFGQAPGGCWCDAKCIENGNCCEDACDVCDLDTCPDPNSCARNCFGQAPGGCFCDASCHNWGDCCEDFCEFCPDTDPLSCSAPDQSCAGNCGDQAESGCWCDEFCMTNGDCCFDACAECPDTIEGCGGSCDGFCGGQSEDGCWCDHNCHFNKNCCVDVCELCGICPF